MLSFACEYTMPTLIFHWCDSQKNHQDADGMENVRIQKKNKKQNSKLVTTII
jgi:hypothetical protein